MIFGGDQSVAIPASVIRPVPGDGAEEHARPAYAGGSALIRVASWHPGLTMRIGLREVLRSLPDLEVVAEAERSARPAAARCAGAGFGGPAGRIGRWSAAGAAADERPGGSAEAGGFPRVGHPAAGSRAGGTVGGGARAGGRTVGRLAGAGAGAAGTGIRWRSKGRRR